MLHKFGKFKIIQVDIAHLIIWFFLNEKLKLIIAVKNDKVEVVNLVELHTRQCFFLTNKWSL